MKTILLAEDSEDDVFFFDRALRQVDPACSLRVVIDGAQVIDYLSGNNLYANRKFFPLPSLVILDIKLPRLTGFEALTWIRQHPRFRQLPVIVLTSSNRQTDINCAYALGVNTYFVKPSSLSRFVAMLHNIHDYWFKLGECPVIVPAEEEAVATSAATAPRYDFGPRPAGWGMTNFH